jgi:hypothetical protein
MVSNHIQYSSSLVTARFPSDWFPTSLFHQLCCHTGPVRSRHISLSNTFADWHIAESKRRAGRQVLRHIPRATHTNRVPWTASQWCLLLACHVRITCLHIRVRGSSLIFVSFEPLSGYESFESHMLMCFLSRLPGNLWRTCRHNPSTPASHSHVQHSCALMFACHEQALGCSTNECRAARASLWSSAMHYTCLVLAHIRLAGSAILPDAVAMR